MEKNTVIVRMLGEFSISNGEGTYAVSNKGRRSKKIIGLLEYLITFRDREIPQNELVEMLWPNGNRKEPANSLKTLLYRARAVLDELGEGWGKRLIISQSGSYAWNNDNDIWVDAVEFERLCKSASVKSERNKHELQMDALSLYKGDFLPRSETEMWTMPMVSYYHTMYLNTVCEVVETFKQERRYEDIIEICQKAITIDSFDEQLHIHMIKALLACGMQQRAQEHYIKVKDLYLDKFGIGPSQELMALYKEITKAIKHTEMNLCVIRDDLCEEEVMPGAFFCEYEFFKDIYRLYAREMVRSGDAVQIALITVMNNNDRQMNQKQLAVAMQRLHEVTRQSLRSSDIVCRYSVSQLLLMLPSAGQKDSDAVLGRISKNYRRKYPHMNVLLNGTPLPMEPRIASRE